MIFEFLILAESGKASHHQTQPATWGSQECPPTFAIVTFESTQEQAAYIQSNCHWDGAHWLHDETGEVFSLDMLIPAGEYTGVASGNLAMATALGWTESCGKTVCDYLVPAHQAAWNLLDIRKYWLRKFFPYRSDPKVYAALEALKNGSWCHVWAAWKEVSADVYTALRPSLTNEDWTYLTERWKVVSG